MLWVPSQLLIELLRCLGNLRQGPSKKLCHSMEFSVVSGQLMLDVCREPAMWSKAAIALKENCLGSKCCYVATLPFQAQKPLEISPAYGLVLGGTLLCHL